MRSVRVNTITNKESLGNNGIGAFPSVTRKEAARVLGDVNGTALGTLAMVTKRLYVFPFQSPKQFKANKVKISVTSQASNSGCSVGIYDNTKLVDGSDNPGNLLDFVDTLITTSTGDKEAIINFNFNKDLLYWIGIVCYGAPTLRALTVASIYPYLGRVANSTAIYSNMYKTLTNSVLPAVAPKDFTINTGNIPAIYVIE